jgi:hypothetical protein
MVSPRSMRNTAAGAVGAGALAGAMLFGSVPAVNAAPAPATSFAIAGPHGDIPHAPAVVPTRGGHGGGGNGGWGHPGPGWGNGWDHPGRGFWGAPGHWWNWWW